MRESEIEKYFCEQVKAIGGMAEKFKSPGRRSVPDRLVSMPATRACRGAHVIFVELKAPGRKPTSAQQRDHQRRRAMGFRVDVLDSGEAVDQWIIEACKLT